MGYLTVFAVCLLTLEVGAAPPAAVAAPPFFPVRLVWQAALGAPPLGPPVHDAGHVFVALRTGSLAGISLVDGATTWSTRLEARGPLATDGERLLVPTDGALEALDPASGSAMWRAPFSDGAIRALAAIGGWVFAVGERSVWGIRADTGERLWEAPLGPTASATTFVEGDRIYVGTRDGHLVALSVKDGSRIWTARIQGEPTGVVADSARVYVGTRGKMFYSLRAKDSSEDWRWRIGADVTGAPLLDRDHVYVVAFDNVLRAFDRGNGAARWRAPLPGRPLGTPAKVGTAVVAPYVAAEVRGFGAADGRERGHYPIDRELSSPPIVVPRPYASGGELLVAVLSNGTTVALQRRLEPPMVPFESLPGVEVPLGAPTPVPGS